ncbi:MAG: Clp protease ClpB, partial [Flaviaesturariibacter sp.]|nr:Clp protease ClpB [Flaviaesturariibacter sp.]
GFGELRFSHTRGAEEDEGTDGPLRVLQAGPAAPHGIGHGGDGFVLTDNKGRVVNFKNTIIIMTSNLGSSIIQDNFEGVNERNKDEVVERTKGEVMTLLRQTIRPEFLNRIDEIILFQPLMRSEIRGIIRIQLEGLKKLVSTSGIQLRFSDYLLDYLSENGFDPQFGARPLKRLIQKEIVNTLSRKILAGEVEKSQPVLVDVFDGVVVFRNDVEQTQAV